MKSFKREQPDSLAKEIFKNLKEISTTALLIGTPLGLITLYSLTFLIGRPELFLASIAVDTNLFVWLATFILLLAAFYITAGSSSIIYIITLKSINSTTGLKKYLSKTFLIGTILSLFCLLTSVLTNLASAKKTFLAVYVVAVIFVLFSLYFFRGGNIFARRNLISKKNTKNTKNKSTKDRRSIGVIKTTQKLEVFKKSKIFKFFLTSALLFYRAYHYTIYILKSKVPPISYIINICKKIKIPPRYFIFSLTYALPISLCCILYIIPLDFILKSAKLSEDKEDYKVIIAAVILFEYGILPGILFYSTKNSGREKFKSAIFAISASMTVIFIFTPGLYVTTVLSTARALGVQSFEGREYLIDKNIPINKYINSEWDVKNLPSGGVQITAVTLYKFSGIIYLCPKTFKTMKVSDWKNNSSNCLVEDQKNIKQIPKL